MSNTFFIKPKPGLIVRDPATKEPLADAGESKPRSMYWLRRHRDGSVVEVQPSLKLSEDKSVIEQKPAKAVKEDSK